MSVFVRRENEDPMGTLCRMVVETRFEDLPQGVVDFAKRAIMDTMGVIIGGSAMEGIPAVVGLVKENGGKQESIVPFYGGRAPAAEAGLAIGPMARAMDLGDVHEEAGHTSEHTVPVLLAANGLKDRITGKELITAYVLGQEVLIRIGTAFKRTTGPQGYGRGSGHYIFGSVAAAGKLLGLSLDELLNAEGIARGKTQPHDQSMYRPATLMVRIHHGLICHDAILACLLVQRGITGPREDVLAGARGYLAMANWETDPDALTRRLGEEWQMLGTQMKPYSACTCTHTAIGGILDQMKEHRFTAQDISSIDIDECSHNYHAVCAPREARWHPQTVPDCQFSMPYVVASAAFDGEVFLTSYTVEARERPEVRALMARITASEDPGLPLFAARVSTTVKDGNRYSKEYVYVKGHRKNPFTEEELISKFKKCAAYSAHKLSDATVDSLAGTLLRLEQVDDVVKDLILPLTPIMP